MPKSPKPQLPHATACEFMRCILSITQEKPLSHVVMLQRGTGSFAHVKIIGPRQDADDVESANLAVELSSGLIAATDQLANVPGFGPRPKKKTADLARFKWQIDPAAYGSIYELTRRAIKELQDLGLW